MKAIMIMFDTLSRRFLSSYGTTWMKTPNFERLQQHCVQFDQFYAGSLPCMPARRELHTGRYNFLHRSWGPLEPFDDSAIAMLHKNGIYTHIVSDHNHYWEDGGATYVTRYCSWEGFRGQEGDHWVGIVDKSKVKIPERLASARKGSIVETCYANRTRIQIEEEFSSVQTMNAGIRFIEENIQSDQWFLQIECFDPHEPFQVPQRFLDLYEGILDTPVFDWPAYAPVCESEADKRQVMIRYAALISMCDEYLGKVLDVMDEHAMWDDTMLIVNTDHGFLMGEHNWWGKSAQPIYQEIVHTPFYLHVPGMSRSHSIQLAQTIDIAPTLLDFFKLEKPASMLGASLLPVVEKDESIHDAILFGYFGGHVNVFDGKHIYMRAPIHAANTPLYEYTLMPTRMKGFIEASGLVQATLCDEFSFLHHMKALRIPAHQQLNSYYYGDKLFDIQTDYEQMCSLHDEAVECEMLEKIRLLMIEHEAPSEQYQRLGLYQDRALSIEDLRKQKLQRQQNDAIKASFSINPQQAAKLSLLKSSLPTGVFDKILERIDTMMGKGIELDTAINTLVKDMMNQHKVTESHRQLFMAFLNNAYEIK